MECSICFENLDEEKRCPRLLHCGHSYCSACLQALCSAIKEGIDKVVTCPTCRNATTVPTGVIGLPKNFALLDVLLTHKQNDDGVAPLCDACDEEQPQHPASWTCLDCKENMCEEAAPWHTRTRLTRDHHTISLEELQKNPKLAVPSFCLEHNEPYRFFDQDCDMTICRDCVALEHSGHKCLTLAKAASKYRQEMQEIADQASGLVTTISVSSVQILAAEQALGNKVKQEVSTLRAKFQEFRVMINNREKALMQELDKHHKSRESILFDQRSQLQVFKACLESGVKRVNSAMQSQGVIQSQGDIQLLVARSDIQSTLATLAAHPLELLPKANEVGLKVVCDGISTQMQRMLEEIVVSNVSITGAISSVDWSKAEIKVTGNPSHYDASTVARVFSRPSKKSFQLAWDKRASGGIEFSLPHAIHPKTLTFHGKVLHCHWSVEYFRSGRWHSAAELPKPLTKPTVSVTGRSHRWRLSFTHHEGNPYFRGFEWK